MRDSNLYTLMMRPSTASTPNPEVYSEVLHLLERREGGEEPRYTRCRRKIPVERIEKGIDPLAYEAELIGEKAYTQLALCR
jgi:hypothetical protein